MVLTVFELRAFKLFLESGEFLAPLRNAANVAEPRVIFSTKAFARHHDRNARWIRNYPNSRNATGQFIQCELFAASGHMVLECGTWQFGRRRDFSEGL